MADRDVPVANGAGEMVAVASRLRAAGCVFAEEEAALLLAEPVASQEREAMVARRIAGEPLEQVLGWAEFCGLRVSVEPGVFVPRRRTELLVREATKVLEEGMVVLDLCCGAGGVGVALASAVSGIDLHAVDIDPVSVGCAHSNLASIGHVYEGDLFEPLPRTLRGRFDVVVANAPYVPTDAIRLLPPEARLHEPLVALDGGIDGSDIQRRVVAEVRTWLAASGAVFIETSEAQAWVLAEDMERRGLQARVTSSDELGATVVAGLRGNRS